MDANTVLPPRFNLTGQVTIPHTPDFMGNYSFVYRGLLRGHPVAVKVIKSTGDPESMKRKVTRERLVWASTNHRNIHPFHGYADDSAFGLFGALISPWSAKGDASRFLKENGARMLFAERMSLWKGVIEGVIYLHDQQPPIVHGDLKPGNVLIDDFGVPKICDFGLARIFLEQGSTGLTTTSEHTGTARYLAPELVASDVMVYPTLASDVYALGCIGLNFIYLQQPFSNHVNNLRGQIFRDLRRGLPPAAERPRQAWPSIRAWSILSRCWNSDPIYRSSAFAIADAVRGAAFTFPLVVVQRIVHSAYTLLMHAPQARRICLRNLSLVSRAYHRFAIPFIYQEIRLDLRWSLQRLFQLMSALESTNTKLLLSPQESDGYGTCTKSLLLRIPGRGPYHHDLAIGIRNLVNRLPGLRYTCITGSDKYETSPNVSSLDTLALGLVEISVLFDSTPILHMLEATQRLLIDRCRDIEGFTRPLQGAYSSVYLPNMQNISLNEGSYPSSYRVHPFAIISTWIMPRLRSLELSIIGAYPQSLGGCLNFLRIHGSQLQHLRFRCPGLLHHASDLLRLCSSLRSLDVSEIVNYSALFSPHPRLERIKVILNPLPFPVTIQVASVLGALTTYMQMARTSFPSLVEAEFIQYNIPFVSGGEGKEASFRVGDRFITCRYKNKTYRIYDGQDTFVEVTGDTETGTDIRYDSTLQFVAI